MENRRCSVAGCESRAVFRSACYRHFECFYAPYPFAWPALLTVERPTAGPHRFDAIPSSWTPQPDDIALLTSTLLSPRPLELPDGALLAAARRVAASWDSLAPSDRAAITEASSAALRKALHLQRRGLLHFSPGQHAPHHAAVSLVVMWAPPLRLLFPFSDIPAALLSEIAAEPVPSTPQHAPVHYMDIRDLIAHPQTHDNWGQTPHPLTFVYACLVSSRPSGAHAYIPWLFALGSPHVPVTAAQRLATQLRNNMLRYPAGRLHWPALDMLASLSPHIIPYENAAPLLEMASDALVSHVGGEPTGRYKRNTVLAPHEFRGDLLGYALQRSGTATDFQELAAFAATTGDTVALRYAARHTEYALPYLPSLIERLPESDRDAVQAEMLLTALRH